MMAALPQRLQLLRKGIGVLALILFHFIVAAQINCANSSTGNIPIVDLEGLFFEAYEGGLYPGGTNTIPAAHLDSGLVRANGLMPLNWAGDVDTVYGKVAMVAIGNVNAQKSFNRFYSDFLNAGYYDSCVRLINACFEEYDLRDMINPTLDNYWKDVSNEVQQSGLTKKQVQVIWVMAPSFDDTVTTNAAYIDTMQAAYIELARRISVEFPNTRLLFFTGSPYGGYVDTLSFNADAVSEPANYLLDFAIKGAISAQINGDTLLDYSGDTISAPWMCWAGSIWADGNTIRTYDGLRWLCPGDYEMSLDGSILAGSGLTKVSSRLYTFFTTSPLTTPWIFGLPYPCYTEIDSTVETIDTAVIPEDEVLWIVTNPVRGVVKFVINLETDDKAEVYIFNMAGQELTEGVFNKIEPGKVFSIRTETQAHGLYVLSVFVDNRVYNKLFYLDN